MGKSDPDSTSSGRKRQLNVIYFVDSARTRSFNIPLGRLNVLLFLLAGMLTWSVASVGLMIWMARGQEDLALRLRQALATVFDYETRYDGVYDVAYPTGDKSGTVAKTVADTEPGATTSGDQLTAAAEAATEAAAESDAAMAPAANVAAADEASGDAAPDANPAEAPGSSAGAAASGEANVVVGNPVLEAGPAALELRFDLSSKSGQDRAEGFVWAVAEFTTADGKKLYIGAPSAIQVKDDGEPSFPQRSAIFGIRRFKKKVFSFPLIKDVSGTFTGIRIGVMDRTGGNRTTYNVPVEIKIGKGGASGESGAEPEGGSQSG